MDKPINVNVEQMETYLCPECESPYCHEVFTLKHVPALMSPTGQDQVIKLPIGFACVACKSGMFKDKMDEGKKPSGLEIVN